MWIDQYQINYSPSRNLEGVDVDTSIAQDDPLSDIYDRVKHKFQYRAEEQGVFHPIYKQGLKLKNNGGIDLFVDQDNGFRLDPNTQTVNVFANHYKMNIHDATSWLTGSETHYISKDFKVKTKGKHIVVSEDNIQITTSKNRIVTIGKDDHITVKGNVSAEIDGNLTAKIKGHATIDVNKNAVVNAHNITLNARNTIAVKSHHFQVDTSSYQVPWMPHEHPQYALKTDVENDVSSLSNSINNLIDTVNSMNSDYS